MEETTMMSNDYRLEEARLESFRNWPIRWIDAEKFVAAGFYYTGIRDAVKCFVCNIEISEWQYNDDPMSEHQRWSSRCDFVRNTAAYNRTDINILTRGFDICGPYGSLQFSNERIVENHNNNDDNNTNINSEDNENIGDSNIVSVNNDNSVRDDNVNANNVKYENVKCENENVRDSNILCRICYTTEIQVVFMPCGHLFVCESCSKNMKNCGVCRKLITNTIKVYLS